MGITMKDSGLQCSIFDGENPLKITKSLRLIELFAGIWKIILKTLKKWVKSFDIIRRA